MKIQHHHPELFYNHSNIEELDLDNQFITELVVRNVGYFYCSLCKKPYLTKNIKQHNNMKHIEYDYYRTSDSSKSPDATTTPQGYPG
jgi:hypothetical protein